MTNHNPIDLDKST